MSLFSVQIFPKMVFMPSAHITLKSPTFLKLMGELPHIGQILKAILIWLLCSDFGPVASFKIWVHVWCQCPLRWEFGPELIQYFFGRSVKVPHLSIPCFTLVQVANIDNTTVVKGCAFILEDTLEFPKSWLDDGFSVLGIIAFPFGVGSLAEWIHLNVCMVYKSVLVVKCWLFNCLLTGTSIQKWLGQGYLLHTVVAYF